MIRLLSIAALALAGLTLADAQQNSGKPFGARDPRTCSSRKDGLSAAQARQYVICDYEKVVQPNSPKAILTLATDVTVEIGRGRPFNMLTDSNYHGIDPSQTVYPIRGSFNGWSCHTISGSFSGSNTCSEWPQTAAAGICYKDSFGDWHCEMWDGKQGAVRCPECNGTAGLKYFPPPTGQ